MMNKLVIKYLLPHYIGAVFCAGGIYGFYAMGKSFSKLSNKEKEEFLILKTDEHIYCLCAILILFCLLLGASQILYVPKETQIKVEDITRKYLVQLFKKNPELKKYEYLLYNRESLKYIACVVCNELSESEQNTILCIANHTLNGFEPKFEEFAKIQKAHSKILDVIKKHADNNPGYTERLLNALDNAEKTCVMRPNAKTR